MISAISQSHCAGRLLALAVLIVVGPSVVRAADASLRHNDRALDAAAVRFDHDETITGCDEDTAVVTRNSRADLAVEIELVGLFDKRTVDAAEEYGAALDIDPQDLRLVGNPHRTFGENMTVR